MPNSVMPMPREHAFQDFSDETLQTKKRKPQFHSLQLTRIPQVPHGTNGSSIDVLYHQIQNVQHSNIK